MNKQQAADVDTCTGIADLKKRHGDITETRQEEVVDIRLLELLDGPVSVPLDRPTDQTGPGLATAAHRRNDLDDVTRDAGKREATVLDQGARRLQGSRLRLGHAFGDELGLVQLAGILLHISTAQN